MNIILLEWDYALLLMFFIMSAIDMFLTIDKRIFYGVFKVL